LVAIVSEGDLVVLAFAREAVDPKDPAKKYTITWFDMFRLEAEKIAEYLGPCNEAAMTRRLNVYDRAVTRHNQSVHLVPRSSRSPAMAGHQWLTFVRRSIVRLRYGNEMIQ
jgi:hypothetical protein